MSLIGKLPIKIPEGVGVNLDNKTLIVTGSKGELRKVIPERVLVETDTKEIKVSVKGKSKQAKALHGTIRALINNMVKGVTDGWSKNLELVGTGYRAEVTDNTLILSIGYSHPVKIEAPREISFRVEKGDIFIDGIDKELVGQIAAKIRAIRAPEPYKGKGIKYKDEIIRRKAGKAAKTVGAPA
ncbi:50S ribosomal protein L6 [Candidatus Woesebacteria bacterium RIFCSPHIGHO2_01_FULL_39_17]|uniref:Large ribosomal subunit protein uL6 n=4 Tax=Microgenomates group TaxID=1794810 RepID=A0A0H4TEF7_9BACT|nr:50S ribosomal protein L6, large subunit ribosomal protein L6 [uncultured Microgenomates bacterium Rifle_16ft_4_minimus_954]KKQ51945.1 MAG: ribosomal protein L6, large subunit ribosomal protein L6 [Microgenomates group bacterium GW2011_GWC1_38_12]KKQ94391.1 MAG: 50S ribosomal protein L6 [Candidatus Woesebacteria bacterium GW2011_GWB1_39_10b]KKR14403.1 MAG: 50S ribosomal protein L6 [Candidatus Woesebacteria bacterium GW2011_GWA1_39_21b]OGM23799.1 MAG: 50S ribosomal protein L6 [Candidatus Woese